MIQILFSSAHWHRSTVSCFVLQAKSSSLAFDFPQALSWMNPQFSLVIGSLVCLKGVSENGCHVACKMFCNF